MFDDERAAAYDDYMFFFKAHEQTGQKVSKFC